MKKLIFALTLILSLTLCLSACKADKADADTQNETFFSDNGYCVEYPEKYEVTSLGSEIDFVIMDNETGSNVTILHTEKQENLSELNEKSFIAQMEDDGYHDIDLSSFTNEEINGTPCIVAEFEFNESHITKIIYDASDNTYIATMTILPGTLTSVKKEFTEVIEGLMV